MVGLALAHQLSRRKIEKDIMIIDKECSLGRHSSGRNSGVLHAGIYYKPESIKARICVKGKTRLQDWVISHGLKINRCGKIIVVQKEELDKQLEVLKHRADKNGAITKFISRRELAALEPDVVTNSDRALWSPETAVVDPKEVIESIEEAVREMGVNIRYNCKISTIDTRNRNVVLDDYTEIGYGHLINCAGINSDIIAKHFSVGTDYTVMPFKGSYWRIKPGNKLKTLHNVYPVPDLDVPFLGIHFTPNADGNSISIGPTATLALGRSCYKPLEDVDVGLTLGSLSTLLKQYYSNKGGFRKYMHEQALLGFDCFMIKEAVRIMPGLTLSQVEKSQKVGIRAQVFDRRNEHLVDDLICEQGLSSTHIINAVSPAFTGSFELADYIIDNHIA